MKKLILLLFIITASISFAQPNGKWEGSIDIMGQKLDIVANFKVEAYQWKGTIDIPQQSAYSLPLSNMSFDKGKIRFELAVNPASVAVFDGYQYMDSISGSFSQAGFNGAFFLLRTIEYKDMGEVLPYTEEEVVFNNADITLAGTLTVPKLKDKVPAVVLITGSGAQNRDEEIFGFKVFQVIADYLSRAGFAVLRYDDRGVGGSSRGPENATSKDFAEDVNAAVSFLMKDNRINSKKIGLIGHSEGGIIAPMVAASNPNIAYIVSIAGSGVPGEQISMFQLQEYHKNSGTPKAQLDEIMVTQKRFYDAVRTGKGWDQVRKDLFELQSKNVHEEVRKQVPDWEKRINDAVEGQIKSAQSGWVKFFMTHDPSENWAKVKVPALILFGGKDTQVPHTLNKAPIEKALKKARNKDYKIEVIENANHLFQQADTGQVDEYAKLEKAFIPGFLDLMTNWLILKGYN